MRKEGWREGSRREREREREEESKRRWWRKRDKLKGKEKVWLVGQPE